MSDGGGGSSSSQTSNTIAPELSGLFSQTGSMIQGLQGGMPDFSQFFMPNPQQIPGLTQGQQNILGMQQGRAFGATPLTPWEQAAANNIIPGIGQATNPEVTALQNLYRSDIGGGGFNAAEGMALNQINQFAGGEIGQSPATQAAMAAVRTPVLNDLAAAGLGNSDAVGSSLAGAYSPILAQELAIRSNVIPQLANMGQQQRAGVLGATSQLGALGNQLRGGQTTAASMLGGLGATEAGRMSSLLGEYGAGEEASRQVQAQGMEANFLDFMRRQGLGSQFLTGILSGFPAIGGQSTVSKQSGGGK